MSRKVCTASARGPYSYVILDSDAGVIATVHADLGKDIVAQHTAMDIAEKWANKFLDTQIGQRHEID